MTESPSVIPPEKTAAVGGEPEIIRRRVVIRGRVHGVMFRDATRRLAVENGLSGWVRNNVDGTVESVFEGRLENVTRLVEFAHKGPTGSRVDHVDVHVEEPEYLTGFELRGPEKVDTMVSEKAVADEVASVEVTASEQAAPLRDRVEWIQDGVAREDLLLRRPLARSLAVRLARIRDEPPDTSFLVHVDGPWGSGKSTLLGFLAEALGANWLVVRYDAWRQARVGPPWWTLLIHLRSSLADSLGRRERTMLRISEAWVRIKSSGSLYLLAVLLSAAAAAGIFLLIRPDDVTLGSVGEIAQTVTAVIAAAGVLVGGAATAARFLLWESARGARVYEQIQRDPMEGLADHFAWLIHRSKRPVVFFIDDLDRCSESHVVDLLDSIQTLVRDSRPSSGVGTRSARPTAPYFVVAADGAWLRRSYERAHEAMVDAVAQPGQPLGYLFLAKIFQLTVPVPALSPDRQDTYFRELLRSRDDGRGDLRQELDEVEDRLASSKSQDDIVAALRDASDDARDLLAGAAVERLADADIEQHSEHVLQKFSRLLEPNPRAMKIFVNGYAVELASRLLEGDLPDRDPLALWFIVCSRWPVLAEALRIRPGLVDAADTDDPIPVDVSDQVMTLLRSPVVDSVIRFADGGPLTRALIEELSGYRSGLAPHE